MSFIGIFGVELEKATVLWYFISAPSNFSKHKISTRNKPLKFETKTVLIEYFRLGFQHPQNLLTCKVLFKNKKTLTLGPKIAYLGIFGGNLIKTYIKFLIGTLGLAKQKVSSKIKKNILGTKNALFVLCSKCSMRKK